MAKYQATKSRGSHTTVIDTSWAKRLIRKAHKEPTVRGIHPGPITKLGGRTKSDYSAKQVPVGIELIIFGSSHKQLVILHTSCPEKTAEVLGIVLKQ